MVKIRVLEINGNIIDIKTRKLNKSVIKLGPKNKDMEFTSDNIFRIGKAKANKIVLKRKQCVLWNTAKEQFYTIEDLKHEKLEGITNADRSKFVKRKIMESLSEMKPMSNMMFFALLAINVVGIIILILANMGV